MEVPECSICLQPFDEEDHIPRSLSCGHSPCQTCLNELPRHWSDSTISLIRCPECTQWVKLPLQGPFHLPKNIELLRLIQYLKQRQEDEGKLKQKSHSSQLQTIEFRPSNSNNSAPKSSILIPHSDNSTPTSNIWTPKSIIQAPKSKLPTPKSDNSTPASNISAFKENIWTPKSNILAPKSKILIPKSGILAPKSNNLAPRLKSLALDDDYGGVPCAKWINWVIPQGAIQLESATEEDEDGVLLLGSLRVSSGFKKQAVGLMPLGPHVNSCPSPSHGGGNSYGESIARVLQSLMESERQEMQILMMHSLVNKGVCRVLGFWMSCEGLVYLVCEKFQRLETGDIQCGLAKLRSLDLSSTSRRMQLNDLSKRATEICEVVVRLHSQALICGCLAPECFELDEFGHPLFSLSKALVLRRRLKGLIRNVVSGAQSSETEQIQNNRILASSLLYLSPEVLSVVHQNEQGYVSDGTAGCSVVSTPEINTHIDFKADVWSLGCLLLMLLVGESPFSDLSFNEFFRAIVLERIKINEWLDDKLLFEPLFSTEEVLLKTQFEQFKHLLCKCFEYEPKNRPHAHDLWRCLSGCSTSSEQPFKDICCLSSSEEDYWCLLLGESLSSPKAEIHSVGEEGPIDDRLQDNNGRGNKLKDIDSNESKKIDARGIGGGMCNANGGTALKMDELEAVTLEGHLDCVTALAVCGEFLLSASYDKTICIWSLHTNSHLETLRGHEHRVLALAVNLEESLCFSGDYGGSIFVWAIDSIPRKEPIVTWHDHQDWRYSGVHSLAISKDRYLYSGSGDKTIKAWSLQDYRLICTMEGHKSVVSALFINEGLLYSGSWDGTVRLWWLKDHSPLAVLEAKVPNQVISVHAVAMCSGILIAVYNNGWLQMWKDDILLKSLQIHNSTILALDGEDDWIFTGGWDKTIKAFNVNKITEDPTPMVIDCNSLVTSLLFHQGKLFVGLANKVIKVTQFC